MSDPRVEAFLKALRRDFRDYYGGQAADERIREIHSHLLESAEEHALNGDTDPIGTSLKEFGQSDGYRLAAATAGGGVLVRRPERTILKYAALTLLIPIAADLAMDFSSWATGSDSALFGIGIPVTLYLFARFVIASSRSRRFLAVPLTGMVVGSFLLYLALGGWARAADVDSRYGTQTRGTAYHRRDGLIREGLPHRQANLERLEKTVALFARPTPQPGVGAYRVAEGYAVPTIRPEYREMWKGDPRSSRWMIDGLTYTPVATYWEAHRIWEANSPELLRFARKSVEGEREEIAELGRVVSCSWLHSVACEVEAKTAMGLFSGFWLLLGHAVGVAGGYLARRRRRLA